MRWVRLDPAPVFAAFGVLTPLGEGADRLLLPDAAGTTVDLQERCGESSLRFRRMDRYGALGYTAAYLALEAAARDGAAPAALAGVAPPGAPRGGGVEADAAWGVMLGSSLACWESIARHHHDLRHLSATEHSPAVFVRTVANAVNGDISIGRGLGGPAETYVSGWTAGAEAILAAGSALVEGRARWILAGGVEAPGPEQRAMGEAAAIALMGLELRSDARPALRLRAYGRAHDADRRLSLATMIDDSGATGAVTVIVANTMETDLLARHRREAGARPILYLPERSGELGAAGAAVAVALADRLPGGDCVLVLARDPEGGTVALALGH